MTKSPENFTTEIQAPSGELILIDSSILSQLPESMPTELARVVDEAVHIPVKHEKAVFEVSADYDDTILRGLNIVPQMNKDHELKDHEPCAGIGCDVDVIDEDEYIQYLNELLEQRKAELEEAKLRSHETTADIALRRHTSINGNDRYKHNSDDRRKVRGRIKNPVARVQERAALNPGARDGAKNGGQGKAARNSKRKADRARKRALRMAEAQEFIDKYYGERVDHQLLESTDCLDYVHLILSNIKQSNENLDYNWINGMRTQSGNILKKQFNEFVEHISSNENWHQDS